MYKLIVTKIKEYEQKFVQAKQKVLANTHNNKNNKIIKKIDK